MSKSSNLVVLTLIILLVQIHNLSAKVDLDSCKKMTQSIIDQHKRLAEKIDKKFNKSLSEIINHKERIDMDIQIIIKLSEKKLKYKSIQVSNVDNIIAIIHNVPFNKADQEYCNKESILKRMSKVKLDAFEKNRREIIDDIKHNLSLFKLDGDEGLAIIAVYSYGLSQVLDLARKGGLEKPLKIGPLNNKQYFKVVKLREGNYYWNRVKNYIPNTDWRIQTGKLQPGSYEYFNLADSKYNFHVEKGMLNFAGVLILDIEDNYLSSDFFDRTTISMKLMEEQYPYLLEKYSMIDGFNENDEFISFYMKEKKRLSLQSNGGR